VVVVSVFSRQEKKINGKNRIIELEHLRFVAKIATAAIAARTSAAIVAAHTKEHSRRIDRFLEKIKNT